MCQGETENLLDVGGRRKGSYQNQTKGYKQGRGDTEGVFEAIALNILFGRHTDSKVLLKEMR